MARAKQKSTHKQAKNRKIVSHFNPKSPIAEQYRTLRTNIQFSQAEDNLRTILVTSPGSGEGKSTTVANLAIVLAQQGNNVLIVDADMRKPTVHYTFETDNLVGISNVLTGQAKPESAISSTVVPHLSVMTCGPVPPNPSELLGSKRMKELVRELTSQFDFVIFDTPPVLAVADAQVLANVCDGTILVIGSGKTDRQGAIKAKELLSQSQAKIIGAVLNGKSKRDNQYYYYYGDS